jgi:hypothetical protein
MTARGATSAPWTRFRDYLCQIVALSLQPSRMEAVVVKGMVLVVVAVALLAFAAGSVFTLQPVTSSRSPSSAAQASRDVGNDGTVGNDERVDAYGNEVTSAVAEYSLDPAGALYERHAPQIELPHLGSPKS